MVRLWGLLVVLVFACPGPASADWLTLQSTHFQVAGNVSEGALRTVALKLEQFRDVVQHLNPAALREDTAPPLVVLVFKDKESYEPFMPRANGKVIPVGGFFQPGQDVNYITMRFDLSEQAYRIVFHEYSHLLLRGIFADAPLWFNEGLAEYYSTFEVSTSRRANIGKPVIPHLQLLRERRLPFAQFFAIDRNSPAYTQDITDRDVLYAQSWAIVHHAFHGDTMRGEQLMTFVSKLAEGVPTETAFRSAYGIEVRDLEREVQLYVQKPAQNYLQYNFPDTIVTRIDAKAAKVAEPEADAWLGDLLAHMRRDDEARTLLEKALAAKPGLALAHTSLGTLDIRNGKKAEGMAHLKEAISLGSTNERAYFTYAYNLINEGDRESATLLQASAALERAIALRPAYTEAKLMLGFTYLASSQYTAARDLMQALLKAEPNNHRAALTLADALLSLGDADGARAAAGPVLARAASELERDQARRRLEEAASIQNRRNALADPVDANRPDPAPPAASADSTRSSTTGAPSRTTRRGEFTLDLRAVAAGEQRVYGVFEAVECAQGEIVIVVRTASGRLRAHAARFADIQFTTFRQLPSNSVGCGPWTPPMEAYLTWRPRTGSNAATDVTAVALEILPEGFPPDR